MKINIDNNVFSGSIVVNEDDKVWIEFISSINYRVNRLKRLVEASIKHDSLIDKPKSSGFFNSVFGPKWTKEDVRSKFINENSAELDAILDVENGYDLFSIFKTLENLGIDFDEIPELGEILDSTRFTFIYYCSQRSQKFHDENDMDDEGIALPLLSDAFFNLSMINKYLANIKYPKTREGQTIVKNDIEHFLKNPGNPSLFDETWHIVQYLLRHLAEDSKSYGTLSQNYIEELFYKAEVDNSITSSLITRKLGDLVFKHKIHEVFDLPNTEHIITVNDISVPIWVTIHCWDYSQKGELYDEQVLQKKCAELVNSTVDWENGDFNPENHIGIENAPNHAKCIMGVASLVNLAEVTQTVENTISNSEPEEA